VCACVSVCERVFVYNKLVSECVCVCVCVCVSVRASECVYVPGRMSHQPLSVPTLESYDRIQHTMNQLMGTAGDKHTHTHTHTHINTHRVR
jgi:hypothetical protein